MTDLRTESWIVTGRRPILRHEVDPVIAPSLRIDRRIGVTAKCPRGHEMPFEVTADEAVVRRVEGTGVTISCQKCETSYILDLGRWPVPFPDEAATG
jgi:hypothetical protein